MKKILRKLQLFDGFWTIPLAFFLFLLAGSYSAEYFGDALISIEYIQQVILAALIMVFANFVVFLGGFFNFRGLQNYFYSKDTKEDLKHSFNSSPWQRIILYVCVYFGLFFCFLFILWLVMTATVSAPPQLPTWE